MYQLEITNLIDSSHVFMYLPKEEIKNLDYTQGTLELRVFLSDHPLQELSQAHEYLLKIDGLSSQGNIFSVSLNSEDNYNEKQIFQDETMNCKFSYPSCTIGCTGESGNEYGITIT